MDGASDRTLTDLDGHVAVSVAPDGAVTIEVSPTGFRQSPSELARLIVETAGRLPNPADEGRDAIRSGAEAVADLHQALAGGGFEAFSTLMRQRLGIPEPTTPPIRSSEHDAILAATLGSTLDNMRQSAVAEPEPTEVLEASATTDEGDLTVTTSTERVIAAVAIRPAARGRGVDGLGAALTALLAKARTELRAQSAERLNENLPEGVAQTMDEAPAEGERAGRLGERMMDDIVQETERLRRKAGE